MSALAVPPAGRPRGRPRDPDIEPRVHEAALALYAERGWYGFTVEGVARAAGVGQAAMYRRWTSKAELLADAITAGSPPLPPVDTGSSRDDLVALASHLVASYRHPVGIVGLRMVLDGRSSPELAEQFGQMLRSPRAQSAAHVVQRALDKGDLVAGAGTGVVLDVLSGATLTHVLYDAGTRTEHATRTRDDRFVADLVATLLR